MERLQLDIPRIVLDNPSVGGPNSFALNGLHVEKQQSSSTISDQAKVSFAHFPNDHFSGDSSAEKKRNPLSHQLDNCNSSVSEGIPSSSSWFLNTVQLTPPYSPGNNSYICYQRDSNSASSNSSDTEKSNPCVPLKLKIPQPVHYVTQNNSSSCVAHVQNSKVSDDLPTKLLKISEGNVYPYPSNVTPKLILNVPETGHPSVLNNAFSPAKPLSSASEVAITSLASWSVAPPCCVQHSLVKNLAESERDSESSLITPECVGNLTCNEGIEIPNWAVGMTGKELEIRLKILLIQQKYREKQKELTEVKKKIRKNVKKCGAPVKSQQSPSKTRRRRRWDSAGSSVSRESSGKRASGPAKNEDSTSVRESLDGEFDDQIKAEIKDGNSMQSPNASENVNQVDPYLSEEHSPEVQDMDFHLQGKRRSQEVSLPDSFLNIRLEPSDLKNGLRLILLEGGLFYAGALEVLDQEALIYGVTMDGQRACRPYVLCQEELLTNALKEVSLTSVQTGDRICAFWSGQLRALYPGSVVDSKNSAKSKSGEQLVTINFDDGDSGQICISDVRALPKDFPLTKIDTPVLPAFITRKRNSRAVENGLVESVGAPKSSRSGSFPQVSAQKKQKSRSQSDPKCGPIVCWEWDVDQKKSYDAIRKGEVVVKVGDLVQLRSDARFGGSRSPTTGHNIYVGFVKKLWETKMKTKKVRVAWCYRSNEVEQISSVKKLLWPDRAVFTSPHTDDNSIETISCRCEVVGWREFCKRKASGSESDSRLYYVAGSYDPVDKRVQIGDDLVDA